MERKQTSPRDIGPYKRYELLTGEISYTADDSYSGYGDGVGKDLYDFISDQMRADWAANRTELIKFWQSDRSLSEFPGNPPWLDCYYVNRREPLPWAAHALDDD